MSCADSQEGFGFEFGQQRSYSSRFQRFTLSLPVFRAMDKGSALKRYDMVIRRDSRKDRIERQ